MPPRILLPFPPRRAEPRKPLVARALQEAGAGEEARDVSKRWERIIGDRVACEARPRL